MKIFENQLLHLVSLILLLAMVNSIVRAYPEMLEGSLLGLETLTWFLLALAFPVMHQVYVWLFWRLELYYSALSRLLGQYAFPLFKAGFAILISGRLVFITLLAIANAGSLNIPVSVSWFLAVLLSIPALWLVYSVFRYFGMDRAFGKDHFDPEIARLPFVKQGIFKYSPNAMYVFGFAGLWVPGLIFMSSGALAVALFNHIYIWVHFYCTELPDIKKIYSENPERNPENHSKTPESD